MSGDDGPDADEAGAWLADLCALASNGDFFFSLNRYVYAIRRPL